MASHEQTETISVNIRIGGKNYPMRVNPSNEAAIREAGRLLGRRVDFYSENYRHEGPEEPIAMAALQIAFDYIVLQRERNETAVSEKVEELIGKIDDALAAGL